MRAKMIWATLAILTVLLSSVLISSVFAADWKPPDMIRASSSSARSSAYAQAAAILGAMTAKTGIQMKVEPQVSVLARYGAARAGEVHFAMTGGDTGGFARQGATDFNVKGWGPQPIRAVWVGPIVPQGMAVRGDSGIAKVTDLKGKRVPRYVGTASIDKAMKAYLAFGGLSYADVVPVDVGSYTDGMKLLLEGRVDTAYAAGAASQMYEMEASPHGLGWVAFPEKDAEGWKRLQKIDPAWVPCVGTSGAGMSAKSPVQTVGKTLQFMAWEKVVSEELAYWFVKNLVDSYASFKDKHPELKNWTLDNALNPKSWTLAYHPGSIKYFKEIGKWSSALEKANDQFLAQEPALRASWEKAHPGW